MCEVPEIVEMSPFAVHSVRFLSLSPSFAHCLAYSEKAKLLAVSRSDNSIEVWNVASTAALLQRWLPGNSESSVESLCWAGDAGDRLFSTGLHGLVLEHSLDALCTKSQFAVTSGPAWCMEYHAGRNRIAVGTEEGYVCLFEVTDDGLQYDCVLDKQEGRILCLAWHSSGTYLVTGSPDTLRVWNVDSGHPTVRISTGRTEKLRETIVWSVAVADDLTIMSGDSRGKTCFWNGKMGTLIDAYQTHKADVLAVAMNPAQNRAYSSGVDPVVMQFQPVVRDGSRPDAKRKWVKSLHRPMHTHDVRSIVATSKAVFSAGVDSLLSVADPSCNHVFAHLPVPHGEVIALAGEAGLVAQRFSKHLEIWRLGTLEEDSTKNLKVGALLPLREDPVKLLQLQVRTNY